MIKEYLAYLRDNPHKYWFKRKLFGWGWTPVRWQGWVVLLGFLAVMFADFRRLDVSSDSASDTLRPFFIDMIFFVAVLLLICYKTGEKPRWQWGIPKKHKE